MTNKTRPQTTPTLGRVLHDIDHTQRAHKLDISKDSKNNMIIITIPNILTSFESHLLHVFSLDGSGICVYRHTGHLQRLESCDEHVTVM